MRVGSVDTRVSNRQFVAFVRNDEMKEALKGRFKARYPQQQKVERRKEKVEKVATPSGPFFTAF